MNATTHRLMLGTLAVTTSVTAMLSSCTQTTHQQPKLTEASNAATVSTVKIDGSSTVYPITKAVAEEFKSSKTGKNAEVTVNFSGTTSGFEKFCNGETDISGASRPILKAEMEACNKNSIRYIELPVAFDALTIAVHPQNNSSCKLFVDQAV